MAKDFEDVLARIAAAGARDFPQVRLDGDTMRRLLGARELPEGLDGERAAEVYLACACASGDSTAIGVLEERYLPRVQASLARGRSPALVEEALQQLLATVFVPRPGQDPEIADYTGAGPLGAWLRIVALRIMMRLEKKQKRAGELGSAVHAIPAPENPELDYLRRKYSVALQDALMEAWKQISSENQVLLRLRYNDNRSVDDIAEVENIHRATAARRVRKAEETLVGEARRILSERLGAPESDVNSMMQLIRSQLVISAGRIFRDGGGNREPR